MSEEKFPVKELEPLALDINDIVNPSTLRAHLALLTKLKDLEQPDEQIDMRYLLRAQERYILWLDLLGSRNFNDDNMPIPPIDVCYIWHSHLLSPLRYYEDMLRIYDPQQKFPDFPLKRLHDIWEKNNGHTDSNSESIWAERTKQPWVLDPNDSSDFKINCPWCKEDVQISWMNYVNLMKAIKADEKCPKCRAPYSVETLGAKRFIDDISSWNKYKTQYIGGTLVDLKDGSYSETLATNDSLLLFTAQSTHICNLTFPESTNWKKCNWKHIIKQLNLQIKDLRKTQKLKDVRAKIVRRIIFAYSGIPSPFSIDLISAVRRQREFTERWLIINGLIA
ncbi:unnamed protein product [Rhizophagus irregularis]|uniref:Uncharacterized protein n=1 Tax=Rhizophagus irregularis TaxID=588596 RepID=A0A916E3X7_9GLOM|nr:unnamed protein product [Rhizophagus irregularis]CAB5181741.1 unnamed protein product [Rhizophagus irregularis]CAB5360356.1 unnamed protein product [Rhizophagus irregularis]